MTTIAPSPGMPDMLELPHLPHLPDDAAVLDCSSHKYESISLGASGTKEFGFPAFHSQPFPSPLTSGVGRLPSASLFPPSPPERTPAGVASDSSSQDAPKAASGSGFDPSVLAALAAEPMAQRELERLHSETSNALLAAVDEVYAMLTPNAAPRSSTSLPTGPTNIRTLMVAQRKGEIMSKDRRALAEGIVAGSVVNLDNPQWDPADPATSKPATQSALLALMQMGE